MTEKRVQLADLVAELCDPYETATNYNLRHSYPGGGPTQEIRVHRVQHPSLIDQLAEAIEPGGTDEGGRRRPGSQPAARIDAIDTLNRIRSDMHAYVTGTDIRTGLRSCIGATWLDDADREQLVRDVGKWIIWARAVTGWDRPPFQPNGACLVCDRRGTLRVRLEPRIATCVGCGAIWDEATIGLLAEAVRAANGEVEAAAKTETVKEQQAA